MIDWSKGPYFIQTEIDYGSGYKMIGSQELFSTPYSFYAETTEGLQKNTTDGKMFQLAADDSGSLNVIQIPKGYSKLVFQDEFNGSGLPDPNKWGHEVGFVRNSEMQYYTKARLENTFQENGNLVIRCINNDVLKNDKGEILNKSTVKGVDYYITSGSITTKNKADWKYCRVEVKVKLPAGSGTWPAIWMVSSKNVYGYWPKSGEIDIMEYIGNEPRKFHYAAHFLNTSKGGSSTHDNATSDWHIFAFNWTEDMLEWSCDGRVYTRYKNPKTDWGDWPFDQSFYLILNLAFGGGWGGRDGFNTDILPVDYLIDYVRIYQ